MDDHITPADAARLTNLAIDRLIDRTATAQRYRAMKFDTKLGRQVGRLLTQSACRWPKANHPAVAVARGYTQRASQLRLPPRSQRAGLRRWMRKINLRFP